MVKENTVKAIVQHRYGPPEVLALEEIGKPVVGDEEVLIRVHAAGLNVGDAFVMRGLPYFMRLFAGLRRPRHPVRGADVAGTVTGVGAKVTDLRPGEAVFGCCGDLVIGGALAEYARAPRDKLAAKPATISFEQAAAVPVAACTALQALRDQAQVQPGQQVLINGASGGVGSFAVQLAKALGAKVTGVCTTSNAELVRSIGADAVINYTRQDFTRGPGRFDVILDNVANHPLSACRRALTPKGTLVPNANTSGRWLGGLGRTIKALLMAPFVPQRIRPFVASVNQADLLALTELIESGKLTPVIDRTYPLSQVPEAIRYLERRHARGKVVITM
jgi:NADPH:quinone reductase-like Zn-dependent oxidoreductase